MDRFQTLVSNSTCAATPWLTAPEFSLCYVLFFIAFAVDFSLITLVGRCRLTPSNPC
jgi:hypothetical protein